MGNFYHNHVEMNLDMYTQFPGIGKQARVAKHIRCVMIV